MLGRSPPKRHFVRRAQLRDRARPRLWEGDDGDDGEDDHGLLLHDDDSDDGGDGDDGDRARPRLWEGAQLHWRQR